MRCLLLLTIMFVGTLCSECLATEFSASNISLTLKNEPLTALVQKVYKKTGYTIILPENFHGMKISGNYDDVTLEELLARVLKGISHSVITIDAEQLLIVKIFNSSSENNKLKPTNTILNNSSFSQQDYYQELTEIANENEKLFQTYINDPNSIDPQSGLSFKEIKTIAATNEAAISKFVNNPSNIDPMSGVPISRLNENYSKNIYKLEHLLNSDSPIDPVTGKTVKELMETALIE